MNRWKVRWTPVVHVLFVLLLLGQLAGSFLHPVPHPEFLSGGPGESLLTADAHPGGETGHDPLHCDVCRILNSSRSYVEVAPGFELLPSRVSVSFLTYANSIVPSNHTRADFLSRAPPFSLLS